MSFRKSRRLANRPEIKRRSRLAAKSRAVPLGPFGEPLRATGAMAKANPFRFSTHYTDDETGLVYAKRRYYSTSSGRWLSKDPIGERGGKNLYGYVNNQPTARFDPFGLFHANANECGVCMVKSIRVVYKGFRGPAANDPFDGAHHTFHTIVELYPAGENLQPIGIRSDPSRCRFRQEVKGYSTFDGEFQKFTAGDSHSGEKPPISPNSFVDDQYSNADNHGTDLVWEFHDSPGISPQKPVSLQDLPPVPGALTWIDWFLEFKAIVEDENPKTGRRSKVAEKSGHWLSIKGYWPNVTGDHGGF